MKPTFIEFLTEKSLRSNDPAMDEYHAELDAEKADVKDAPFGVIVTDLIDDEGKPHYYDTLIAVNINNINQAERIRDKIQAAVEDGSFYHKAGNSTYHAQDVVRVEVIPMRMVDKVTLQYSEPRWDGTRP